MALLDVDALLRPVSDEQPCGESLDYDPDYLALERSIEGQPERQYGDTIIAAEGPDWAEVAQQSKALLGRAKDFQVAITLTRSLTRRHGVEGAVAGLELLIGLGTRYWADAYPALSFDGEPDLLPRANTLATLAAQEGLLGDLRASTLTAPQIGKLELGVIERVINGGGDAGSPLNRHQLELLLSEEGARENPTLLMLTRLRERVGQLAELCRRHMLDAGGTADAVPDFVPLMNLLETLCPATNSDASPDAEDSDGSTALQHIESSRARQVSSRQDCIRLLDSVCSYLAENDPSNPAPLLIRRARGLIGRDFLSILRELAPDGVAQAELLAGTSHHEG